MKCFKTSLKKLVYKYILLTSMIKDLENTETIIYAPHHHFSCINWVKFYEIMLREGLMNH